MVGVAEALAGVTFSFFSSTRERGIWKAGVHHALGDQNEKKKTIEKLKK
jgi:hypothetical protein